MRRKILQGKFANRGCYFIVESDNLNQDLRLIILTWFYLLSRKSKGKRTREDSYVAEISKIKSSNQLPNSANTTQYRTIRMPYRVQFQIYLFSQCLSKQYIQPFVYKMCVCVFDLMECLEIASSKLVPN